MSVRRRPSQAEKGIAPRRGERRRQGFRRPRAAPRQGRPRPRGRYCRGHRHHEPSSFGIVCTPGALCLRGKADRFFRSVLLLLPDVHEGGRCGERRLQRWRKATQKERMPTAMCRPSSSCFVQRRICARPKLSVGLSGRSGHWSSTYSQITVNSMMTRPLCTSVGTTAFGFSLRYSGFCASPRRRSR